MSFVGVGGAIDGVTNPDLQVNPGDVVQITLVDGDGAEHNIAVPDFGASSDHIVGKDASTVLVFTAGAEGTYPYFCEVPGHRQAGMEGNLIVGAPVAAAAPAAPSIVRDPADLPPPISRSDPQTVRVTLQAKELTAQLADGATYTYMTFDGKVPGPMIRVRLGDTVELTLKNPADSAMTHSIDLHAVTGPGGGSAIMQVSPGEQKTFTFKTLKPGLFVYHCATPMVAEHISSGMYGMILVEPAEGLRPVDKEFYVMQGEIYTQAAFGAKGPQQFSVDKLLAETPDYFVFNGAVGALTTEHPLQANVGDTVRIFFGVGGPNFISSFHVIGESIRPGLRPGHADLAAADRCADHVGAAGRRHCGRIQAGSPGPLPAGRPRPLPSRTRPRRLPERRRRPRPRHLPRRPGQPRFVVGASSAVPSPHSPEIRSGFVVHPPRNEFRVYKAKSAASRLTRPDDNRRPQSTSVDFPSSRDTQSRSAPPMMRIIPTPNPRHSLPTSLPIIASNCTLHPYTSPCTLTTHLLYALGYSMHLMGAWDVVQEVVDVSEMNIHKRLRQCKS